MNNGKDLENLRMIKFLISNLYILLSNVNFCRVRKLNELFYCTCLDVMQANLSLSRLCHIT